MKFSALLLIYLIGVEAKGKRSSGSSADKHRQKEGGYSSLFIGNQNRSEPIGNQSDVSHGNIALNPPKYGHYGLKSGFGGDVINGAKSGDILGKAVEQSNSMPVGSTVSPEPQRGFSNTHKKNSKKRDEWAQLEQPSESFSYRSAGASLGQRQHSNYGDGAGQGGLLGTEFGQSDVQGQYLGSGQAAGQSGQLRVPYGQGNMGQYLGSGQIGLLGAAFGQSNVQGQYLGSGQAAGQSGLQGAAFGLSNAEGGYSPLDQAAGQSGLLGNYRQNNIQVGYQSLGQSGGQGGLLRSLPGQWQEQYFGQPGISGLGLGIGGSAQLQYPGVIRRDLVRIWGQPGSYYGRVPLGIDGHLGISNGQSHIQAQQQGFALPAVGYGTAAVQLAQAAYSGPYSEQTSGYNYGRGNAQGQNGLLGLGSTAQGPYSGVANPMGYLGTGGNAILGSGGQPGAASLWNLFARGGGVGQFGSMANGTGLPTQLGQNLCPMGYTILAGRCVLANGLIAGYGGVEKAGVVSSAEFTGKEGGAFQQLAVGRNIAPGFYYLPRHLNM